MIDIIIKNGTLLDGSGGPAFQSDIAIHNDRIVDIAPHLNLAEANAILDAKDHWVCPGFIDTHSHSDAYLLIEPSAASKLFQGITTEVVGNCGASAAPCLGAARLPSDWQTHTYPGQWQRMGEFRTLLETTRPAVNVVALIGHNVLRASIMGYEGRNAGPDEISAMVRLLEESLDAGGRGLSTGLIYPPGMYAAPQEIHALASTVARHGGIYTSHMRSESSALLAALEETIGVSRSTGVTVQISHLKTSGKPNWPLIDKALALINSARSEGIPVAADRYPYTSSCTELDVIFPNWATEGGREAELDRLRDPATRLRLRQDILTSRSDRSWGTIVIGSTNAPFRGMPLEQAAITLGMEPVDAALHLIETDNLMTSAFFQGMSEDNLWRILAEPWVMIGSDASLRAPWGPLSIDYPHPRAYGSFPRFLRAAIDGKTVPLPDAVRKMTSLPATQFSLEGRGTLKRGAFADITVVDPARLRDNASYANPHCFAEGITDVLVNGIPVLSGGQLTGQRTGRWL
jgi:N-acyl-D-amino-acid deacylase